MVFWHLPWRSRKMVEDFLWIWMSCGHVSKKVEEGVKGYLPTPSQKKPKILFFIFAGGVIRVDWYFMIFITILEYYSSLLISNDFKVIKYLCVKQD